MKLDKVLPGATPTQRQVFLAAAHAKLLESVVRLRRWADEPSPQLRKEARAMRMTAYTFGDPGLSIASEYESKSDDSWDSERREWILRDAAGSTRLPRTW